MTYGQQAEHRRRSPTRRRFPGAASTAVRPAATCPPTSRTTIASRSARATTRLRRRRSRRPRRSTTTTAPTSTSRPICIPRTAAWSRVPTTRTWAATTGWPTPPSRSSRTKTGPRMHLNFSGIDKIGHMWGGGAVDTLANYNWDPSTIMNEVHMPWIAKNADDQLGRVIAGAQGQGRLEQHPVRRARRPRLHLRRERALRRRGRRRQPRAGTTTRTTGAPTPPTAVRGRQQRRPSWRRSTPPATSPTAISRPPSRPGSSTAAGPRRPRRPRR